MANTVCERKGPNLSKDSWRWRRKKILIIKKGELRFLSHKWWANAVIYTPQKSFKACRIPTIQGLNSDRLHTEPVWVSEQTRTQKSEVAPCENAARIQVILAGMPYWLRLLKPEGMTAQQQLDNCRRCGVETCHPIVQESKLFQERAWLLHHNIQTILLFNRT